MKLLKYILVLLVVFTSCKSNKSITTTKVVKQMSARRVAKKHTAENFEKRTIDAKLKVNYKDRYELD